MDDPTGGMWIYFIFFLFPLIRILPRLMRKLKAKNAGKEQPQESYQQEPKKERMWMPKLEKESSGMAGWIFFNLELSDAMLSVIETSGMMINAQGFGFNEQLKNYLGHYLETKGSNCRIKKIDY